MAIFNGKKLPTATYNGARMSTIINTNENGGSAEVYEGSYEVTPTTEEQSLDTDGKLMTYDVTVKEIPVAEVTNSHGGTTVTIG